MSLASDPVESMANRANGTRKKVIIKPCASQSQSQPQQQSNANSREPGLVSNKDDDSSQMLRSCQGTSAMNVMSSQFSFEDAMKKAVSELKERLEKLGVSIHKDVQKDVRPPDFTKHGFSNLSKSNEQAQDGELAIDKPASWMPAAVRNLPPLGETKLGQKPLERDSTIAFSERFLVSTLGGKEWSPGLWYTLEKNKHLPSKTYYLLSGYLQPYLPKAPGEHGAMLTVFFHDFPKEQGQHNDVPLFVCDNEIGNEGEKLYRYLGTYTQFRWSDKLDFDHVADAVPEVVKKYWAKRLVRPEREQWETDALREHFVPKPNYVGEVPKTKEYDYSAFEQDMKEYIDDLIDWEQESMDVVNSLDETKVLEAFGKEDAGEVPGLRFWWEYLQCVGFDRNFYYELVTAWKSSDGDNNNNNYNSIFGGQGKE